MTARRAVDTPVWVVLLWAVVIEACVLQVVECCRTPDAHMNFTAQPAYVSTESEPVGGSNGSVDGAIWPTLNLPAVAPDPKVQLAQGGTIIASVGNLDGSVALWGAVTPSAHNWTLAASSCEFSVHAQAPLDGGPSREVRHYHRCDDGFRACFMACGRESPNAWRSSSDEEQAAWLDMVVACADACAAVTR